MYVKDVEDGKRTYRHIFIITFLIWYHLYVMLCMLKMSKIDFRNFLRIENQLIIKEVISQNVCVCSLPIFDIHSLTPLMCTLSIFDILNIALIFCTVFNAMYLNTSNIKQCALTHIDTCPLMYTQHIR